jgi:cell division transport system permease protein
MTFASVSSISISLFILGLFLLLTLNVNYLAQQIESQVEIRVYLEVGTTDAQIATLQQQIQAMPQVASVKFVSKEEGLQYLRNRLGESGKDLLQGFDGDNNPLNDSFTVEVKDPHSVGDTAGAIEQLNEGQFPRPIYKVSYGKGTVESMFKVTEVIRNVGLVLVLLLAVTAIFLIANTIKLTIINRRREISIMKLVGATNSFIRWPFFIEGALLGFLGSLIPVAALLYGYWALLNTSQVELNLLLIKLLPWNAVSYSVAGLLLGLGVVIGIWGSLLSVRKYLRV